MSYIETNTVTNLKTKTAKTSDIQTQAIKMKMDSQMEQKLEGTPCEVIKYIL